MNSSKMSVFNDDGVPLDLNVVFILFLMPNFTFILLTSFNTSLVYVSKKHPRLNRLLGKMANFFAKGALDRIIRNMLRHFEEKKRQQNEQIPMVQRGKSSLSSKNSHTSTNRATFEKRYDANYLLLIPFQLDLLLTVFIYKILTRDVYSETCQSFLTTYANREKQVICWLKHINRNTSNLSFNISLPQYCTNQTIIYINFEHTDVICIQYVFKVINIIDTVTNIFAWHQAVVFIVTKSIVVSYWFQQKLRQTSCWLNLFPHYNRIIILIIIFSISSIYILLFIFILPIYFASAGRMRIDLTRHLIYACAKFLVGIILHANLYTLYQWHSHTTQKNPLLIKTEEKDVECQPAIESIRNSELSPFVSTMMIEDHLGTSSTRYLTPNVSV
jgi:hypothetical protein